jgi:hypothetical protein
VFVPAEDAPRIRVVQVSAPADNREKRVQGDDAFNIVFHNRRGLSGTKTGVTQARSLDGGKTFVNYQAPVEPFDCCAASNVVGDYNGVDADGGRVVAVFLVITGGQQRIMAALTRFRPGTQQLH